MEQGRGEDSKEPMESDPDYESGENTTSPKMENTLDILGSLTRTLHQLSAVTGLSRDVELPRYDGSYEAQSFFTNYDAQADRTQLQYSTRLRKSPNLLQAPLRVTNTRAGGSKRNSGPIHEETRGAPKVPLEDLIRANAERT
ncbi:hypothetical protein LAZ67_2003072 [Cordylochernes scorpioides]|uniref:Uncharacterized protein n=1 Tax=Cordylochernes scorpioides TaxID=51811 RepID=A0ABY6K5R4_9ARAC|nr:hypothetical protein LAZ67_2003072 [Cordylochernes scorpioides]